MVCCCCWSQREIYSYSFSFVFFWMVPRHCNRHMLAPMESNRLPIFPIEMLYEDRVVLLHSVHHGQDAWIKLNLWGHYLLGCFLQRSLACSSPLADVQMLSSFNMCGHVSINEKRPVSCWCRLKKRQDRHVSVTEEDAPSLEWLLIDTIQRPKCNRTTMSRKTVASGTARVGLSIKWLYEHKTKL